jgi:hypothetical protein
MRIYKGLRCFECDSVILASMPNIVRYPPRQPEYWMLECPECSTITLQLEASELKNYLMSRDIRSRGYAKRGEWSEMAS